MPTLYRWTEITVDARGRDKRRELPYRMSQDEAVKRAAGRPGVRFEMVPGSAEEVAGDDRVGWGHHLKTNNVIDATGAFAARTWKPDEPGT